MSWENCAFSAAFSLFSSAEFWPYLSYPHSLHVQGSSGSWKQPARIYWKLNFMQSCGGRRSFGEIVGFHCLAKAQIPGEWEIWVWPQGSLCSLWVVEQETTQNVANCGQDLSGREQYLGMYESQFLPQVCRDVCPPACSLTDSQPFHQKDRGSHLKIRTRGGRVSFFLQCVS